MDDDSFFGVLKGFLRIGIFIGGTGFVLALMQPRDSDEFVVSVCSGMIGLVMVIGVIVALRVMGPHVEKDDRDDAPPA
jgi:hypothetical protein